jgi:non-homologous end joining protein Ku
MAACHYLGPDEGSEAAGEVRPVADVPGADAEPAPESLTLAVQLLAQMCVQAPTPIDVYVDAGELRLQERIQQKIDEGDVTGAPSTARPAPIVDVVDALKASLEPKKAARRRRHVTAL